ncbi:DUF6973 domain-containing protein [Dyadobacter sp. CY347]|uniref:DUF6973 domain-containing protein n=1 Tax=Dyadobacter sp. CY347 TaxID=2909336 RepID=UPI001F477D2D|nr:hypothetical protein [Dyadobacter sp. CY347]MCF2489704.1 hypothetical protein [Dyadobacter sp. CY347]
MQKFSPFRRIASCISFLLVFVFAFSNQSCREDLDPKSSPENSPAEKVMATEDRMLTYDQFLEQVRGFKDKEMYDHFRSSAEKSLRSSEKIIFPFPTLPSTTDSVRKLTINNHTTYTIPVYRRSHTCPVFRNIIIDSTDTGVKAYLAWYFPDKKWIQEYKKDRKRSFYGTVIMNNYDGLPSSGRPEGRTNLVPVCASVMVLSGIVEHLCCHNSQHTSCGCPTGTKYYFEYQYNTVTTCIDSYIDAFGGYGGSGGGTGGGSGGGTVPNPGGGYDPCQQPKTGTGKTPCTPNTPDPGPVVVPNANVVPLVSIASAKGVSFNSTEMSMLNSLSLTTINRIKNLISKFGGMVEGDYDNLMTAITGDDLSDLENGMLDILGDGFADSIFIVRLIYAANAYAAQTYTAVKYNICGSTCSGCKANAFKHALFLIFNAELFTIKAASALASAHEDGQVSKEAQMDRVNNATGQKIYEKFLGSGTPNQWADRVKIAADNADFGMTFLKSDAFVSTKTADNTCL